jgi:RimJ/RimL family protein N-acetyltransferase
VSQVVAHTERLVLRPLTPIDAAAATREPGLLDDDVQQNQSWIQTWCVEQQRDFGLGYWGCWRGADERLVGFCGWRSHDFGVALGFGLGRTFRGQGYATEAAVAAIEWALARYGPEPLFASVRPPNAASVAVLTRVGMVHRATRRDSQGERWLFSLPGRADFSS